MKIRTVLLVALALTCAPGRLVRTEAGDGTSDFAVALSQFQAGSRSEDMHTRMLARVALARTHDLRALRLLADNYSALSSPEERGAVVSLAARCFNDRRDLVVHRWWRERPQNADDPWLWFRGLVLEHVKDAALVQRQAGDAEHMVRRLAAIEALAARKDAAALESVPHLLAALPPKSLERHLLIGGVASLVFAFRDRTASETFRVAARALAGLLDDASTSDRSARLIRRYLAAALGESILFRTAKDWDDHIAGHATSSRPLSSSEPMPEFFGLQSIGNSVCYLIDLSDSMATRLTDAERRDFQAASGRTTGLGEPVHGAGDGSSEFGPTKLDAVRDVLKASLRALPARTLFAVVGFGDTAELVGSSGGLIRATRANVEAVVRQLDKIVIDKRGCVRGSTNLHGALRIGLGLREVRGDRAGVQDPIEAGVETLFVLSDGMPNRDDWGAAEADSQIDGGDYGSFAAETQLLEDIQRANLFLKAEIHCVGVGHSSRRLLCKVARCGLGSVRVLGGGEPAFVDTRSSALEFAEPDRVRSLLREIDPADPVHYRGDDPRARIRIMEELGALNAQEALPALVHALGSLDRSERQAALKVVQSLTGVTMGALDDVQTLDGAVRLRGRWTRWLRQQGN